MIGDNKPDPPPKLTDSWVREARDAGLVWNEHAGLCTPAGEPVNAYLSSDGGALALGLSTGEHQDAVGVLIPDTIAQAAAAGDHVGRLQVAMGDGVLVVQAAAD